MGGCDIFVFLVEYSSFFYGTSYLLVAACSRLLSASLFFFVCPLLFDLLISLSLMARQRVTQALKKYIN